MGEPPLPEWILHFTGSVFPWWANLLVHSTILVSFGLFAAYAFRNRGAAVQSLILRITLASVFLSPLITLTADRLGMRGLDIPLPSAITAALEAGRAGIAPEQILPPRTAPVAVNLPTVSAVPPSAAEAAAYEAARNEALLHTAPPPSGILSVMIPAIIIIWVILSLTLVLRLLFFFLKIRQVRNSAFDARSDLVRECEAVARELNIEPPMVLQSGLVESPFLTGLFRPAVLLPFSDVKEEPVTRDVLLHELAHLVRWDCFWNLLSQFAAAILSIQPLLRVLSCRMEEISDHVCDDFVVKNSPNLQAYARHLYEIAQRSRPTPAELAIGVGIVAFRSSLGQRVERIMDRTRRFSLQASSGTIARTLILGGLATILMGLTGFRDPLGNGVAGIVKTVSAHTAAVSRELKIFPVSIVQETALKTTPPEANAALATPTADLSGAGDAALVKTLPEELPVPSDTAPVSAALSPSAPAPDVTLPATQAAGSRLGGDARADGAVAQNSAHPEQSASPVQIAPAGETENHPDAPGRSAPVTEVSPNEPVLNLSSKESCIREGNRMLDIGDYASAERAFMKATEFDLKNPEISNLLGKAYYGKREYDKAILAYKSAIAKKNNFADAYYNMGDVYLAQGKQDEAMAQYKTAIQLNSAYAKRKRSFF